MENTNKFNLDEVADELKELLIEAEFSSRWTLIQAYHTAGKMIKELCDHPDNLLGKDRVVQVLAEKIGKSERMVWYASKFYEKYPVLDELPEGKNIGWNKVVTKYLTTPKEEACGHEHTKTITIEKCEDCGKTLKTS